tara:strand:- start:883 stop:1692 length:810 start_codon:yes stop_codon:yes gene_type:complete
MAEKIKTHNYRNMAGSLVIKDVDTKSGIVAGYFSATGNIDADGDLIEKGAFSKSIQERGANTTGNRKISHLAFHDVRRPVGNIEVLKEDDKGLYFESKMGSHTDGQDALKMYDSGIIREHSIGFQYIADKTKWIELEESKSADIPMTAQGKDFIESMAGYYQISEVKLWEGSFVTFGANSETPSFGVIKSLSQKKTMLAEINERMNLIRKEICSGTYSDGVFSMLDTELAYVQECYNSLVNTEPSVKDTLAAEPIKDDSGRLFLLKSLI